MFLGVSTTDAINGHTPTMWSRAVVLFVQNVFVVPISIECSPGYHDCYGSGPKSNASESVQKVVIISTAQYFVLHTSTYKYCIFTPLNVFNSHS